MSETRLILGHAATVLGGQMAVMAFGVVDTMVAARHSEAALAALSIGVAIYITVFVSLNGVLQALLPVWAGHHGAGEAPALGHSVHQALYLWLALSLVGIAGLLGPRPLMELTGVPPAMQQPAAEYLALMAPALPLALLFRMYGTLNQALGRPRPVALLQLGGLLLKIPLTVWLVSGGAGMPALGLAGCGWSTLIVTVLMVLAAGALLRTDPLYAPLRLWRMPRRPDRAILARLSRLGLPAGLAVALEVSSFTAMALLVARQGPVAAAAHQIASNLAAVLYMVPLSLAIASSARVGWWLGAGNPAQARRCAGLGLRLAMAAAAGAAIAVIGARDLLAAAYAGAGAPAALMAAALLPWVAAYHAADAIQSVCIFLLRCWAVVLRPLLVYAALLWGLGIGGGTVLAYHGLGSAAPWKSPAAFWAAGALALLVTAGVFSVLLWRAARSARAPVSHAA